MGPLLLFDSLCSWKAPGIGFVGQGGLFPSLLLDFWHPDIEPDERSAIVEMFQYAKQEGWLK